MMNKKRLAIFLAILPVAICGCNEEKIPLEQGEKNSLSVRVLFPGTQSPESGNSIPYMNDLILYFVENGIIKEVKEISTPDIPGVVTGKVFTDLPHSLTEVIAIGNTHTLHSPGITEIGEGATVEELGKTVLQHDAQSGRESPVLFYGSQVISGSSFFQEVAVSVVPVVSRIKIGKVEAMKAGSGDHIPLTGFKLAGIYINNTYTALGLDGKTRSVGETGILNYSSDAPKWIDGAYPTSFRNEFYEVATNSSFTSVPEVGWEYDVLPAMTGNGTFINNQKQEAIPHIILKIEAATSKEGYTFPSPAYVTIKTIMVDSVPLSQLEKGKVYNIASLCIGGQHLSAKPETAAKAELKAEATVSDRIVNTASSTETADLQTQTANCYLIAPETTDFRIPVSRANADGVFRIGDTDEIIAELVWTDTTDSFTPASAIQKLDVQGCGDKGFLCVSTGSHEGNAVVAVRVGTQIRWSWHIWVTHYHPSVQAGTFMDRNLGATSNDFTQYEGTKTLGLFYQWGRKDPFPASPTVVVSEEAPSGPNLERSIANPQLFYYSATGNCDWYAAGNGQRNNYLWNSIENKKTPYDPCPAGWRVPAMSDVDIFTADDFSFHAGELKGRESEKYGGWYPAAGSRSHADGSLHRVGIEGMYWNSSPFGAKARILYFYDNFFLPGNTNHRACALPVRCISEK